MKELRFWKRASADRLRAPRGARRLRSALHSVRAADGLVRYLLVFTAVFQISSSVHAQGVSVGKKAKDNSVEAQLAAFRLHEDFEVSLFADEKLGIANPVAMHWDECGRLWVLTTLTYAQLEPGEKPNDTLVILEDTERRTVGPTSRRFLRTASICQWASRCLKKGSTSEKVPIYFC